MKLFSRGRRQWRKMAVATGLSTALLLALAGSAIAASLSGAIFTTTPDGGIVNENVHYTSKLQVYLDGGPGPNAPQTAAGLPDGLYVFQITDPPGKVLLSEDPSKCRIVEVGSGVVTALVPPSDARIGLDDTYGKGKSPTPCHIQEDPDRVAGPSGQHDTNTDIDHSPRRS